MKARLSVLAAFSLALIHSVQAHLVDEYLQATFIAVEQEQLRVDVFLTPGVDVLPVVMPEIDTDGNGVFSAAEQQSYAARVLQDLSFALNGAALAIELKGIQFPTPGELRDGRGDIHLELAVKLRGAGLADAKLFFENRHQRKISAYAVNCLAPRDPTIRLGQPQRNPEQSTLALTVAITDSPLAIRPGQPTRRAAADGG